MSGVDTHHQLPIGMIEDHIHSLEHNSITIYTDETGVSWAISHNEKEYDIVYTLLQSYED